MDTKITTVKEVREVDVPVLQYTLSQAEATMLYAIMGSVGGVGELRAFTDALYFAAGNFLRDSNYDYVDFEGDIIFKDNISQGMKVR